MKLSEETRRKHKWLLRELRAISKELEEIEDRYLDDARQDKRGGAKTCPSTAQR